MKIFKSWQELADYLIEVDKKDEIEKLKAEITKLEHDRDFLDWLNKRRARTIKKYEEFTDRLIHELRKANKGCRRLRCKLNAAEEEIPHVTERDREKSKKGQLTCKDCRHFDNHPFRNGDGTCFAHYEEVNMHNTHCYLFESIGGKNDKK